MIVVLIVVLMALFTAEFVSALDDGEFCTRFGVYLIFGTALLFGWFLFGVS